MKKLYSYIIAVLIFSGIYSCRDEQPGILPIEGFPLKTGNEWFYRRTLQFIPPENSAVSSSIPDSLTYNLRFWVEKDTIVFNGIQVKKVCTEDLSTHQVSTEYLYMDSLGLECQAYSHAGIFVLKSGSIHSQWGSTDLFQPIIQRISNDPVYIDNPPRLIYKYPLTTATSWNYYKSENPLKLGIEKKVEGARFIEIGSKTYYCAKINWTYSEDPSFNKLTCTEYLSEYGLVKIQWISQDVSLTTDDGQEIEHLSIIETITLTGYSLQ